MSDKLRNFLIGGGLSLVWVMTLGWLDWRSSVHADESIKTAFMEASIVSPAEVAANTESINDLEKEAEKLDNKIERIVDILLEP